MSAPKGLEAAPASTAELSAARAGSGRVAQPRHLLGVSAPSERPDDEDEAICACLAFDLEPRSLAVSSNGQCGKLDKRRYH